MTALAKKDIIEEQDKKHRATMFESGRMFNVALGITWPCDHRRTPENTHRVGEVAMCKVCRRRRWMRVARVISARRRLVEHMEREAELERQEFKRHQTAKAREVRAELSAKQLAAMIVHPPNGRLPLDEILQAVAKRFDLTIRLLRGKSRKFGYTEPRAIVMKILHERGLSYPQIGRLMGGRDHSTVINAVKMFDIYAARDPRVLPTYLELRDKRNG